IECYWIFLAQRAQRITEHTADLDALRNHATELRVQFETVHGRRDSAAHRLTSLEDLDAHHAYYSDSVQQGLSPEHAARINALGTLADFVEVEPQYERLIESLFARELQSVLVPTIDDALAGVDHIRNEGLGRGAFLVVGLHGGEDDSDAENGREDVDNGGDGDAETSRGTGIEEWLITTDESLGVSPFQEQYVPPERQLPPADLTVVDSIVIELHPEVHVLISDSQIVAEVELDDRASARHFDDEETAHASR